MHTPQKSNLYLLLSLFLLVTPLSTLPTTRNPIPITATSCGNIRIEPPLSLQHSNISSPSHKLLCRSKKLYFRTSLGLFPVSSIDYKAKTLTISHSSCSPSSQFISPSLITAGLPAAPQPNSLILFNCNSRGKEAISSFLHNCSSFYGCKPQDKPFPCLLVNDTDKLEFRFHPKDLSCSHYRRVYGSLSLSSSSSSSSLSSSSSSSIEGLEFGTRVSFEVPDHLPRICDECSKPNGNCGVGLRCICHAKECKDKVISRGVCIKPYGNLLFYLVSISVLILCFDELVRES